MGLKNTYIKQVLRARTAIINGFMSINWFWGRNKMAEPVVALPIMLFLFISRVVPFRLLFPENLHLVLSFWI